MRFLRRSGEQKLPKRLRSSRRMRRRLALAVGVATVLTGFGGGVWVVRAGIVGAAVTATGTRIAAAATELGFAVDNVSVVGRARTSRQAILEALDVQRGAPILSFDLAAAKARLESLAWIRSAEIERRLPDTIFVHIAERQPLAYWQRQGKLVLIDREGKVVPVDRLDAFGQLVVLVGDDAPKTGAALLDMLATEPQLAPHVAAAVRIGGRRWNLRLDNGIDVSLPEREPEIAWHRLAGLARDDRLLERDIAAVDLRLPDRLFLRLPQEPPKPGPAKKTKGGKST
jgi:cell division protein FtsQ